MIIVLSTFPKDWKQKYTLNTERTLCISHGKCKSTNVYIVKTLLNNKLNVDTIVLRIFFLFRLWMARKEMSDLLSKTLHHNDGAIVVLQIGRHVADNWWCQVETLKKTLKKKKESCTINPYTYQNKEIKN